MWNSNVDQVYGKIPNYHCFIPRGIKIDPGHTSICVCILQDRELLDQDNEQFDSLNPLFYEVSLIHVLSNKIILITMSFITHSQFESSPGSNNEVMSNNDREFKL